jgi:hypothetical protein
MNTKNSLQEMEINSLETVTGGHVYFGRIAVMAAEALLASAAVVDAGGAFGMDLVRSDTLAKPH